MELLVASSMGMLVLAMTLASTTSFRTLFITDTARTHLNQDLRGTIDLMGSQIRLAGEGFGGRFPALLIVNGADGASDELILRRKVVNEVLKVCSAIPAGDNGALIFADESVTSVSGCAYSDNTLKYDTWAAHRQSGETLAFIFDGSANGEFFNLISEDDTGTAYSVSRSGSWQFNYPVNSAAYVIEEWRFRVQGEVLELIIDNDDSDPLRVAQHVTDFQVQAQMQDGSTKDELTASDDWSKLRRVSIELVAADEFRGDLLSRTMKSDFFPRNVLSN